MKRPVTRNCWIKGCRYLVWQCYPMKKNPKIMLRRRFCLKANYMPSYLKCCPLEEE